MGIYDFNNRRWGRDFVSLEGERLFDDGLSSLFISLQFQFVILYVIGYNYG